MGKPRAHHESQFPLGHAPLAGDLAVLLDSVPPHHQAHSTGEPVHDGYQEAAIVS